MPTNKPTSRRAFLRSSALVAVAAAVAAACGKSGAKGETSAAPATAAPTDPAPSVSSTTRAATPTTARPGATSTTGAPPATSAPAGAWELQVSFVYAAAAATGGAGGRGPGGVHNPYVAVWIEDQAARSVRTLSLNYQRGKGDKWLSDLRRWFRADQARKQAGGKDIISTISAATRVPGTYNVAWDGTTDAGAAVGNGTYFVCIESARENGPYSLIREEITIGGKAFDKSLAAQGELQNAVAKLVVK